MNISEILIELRIGTQRSFDYFFHLHYDQLVTFVDRYVKMEGAAEDIVLETFTKFWNSRHANNFDTEKDVQSFLFTTARRLFLNYLRDHMIRKKHHMRIIAALPALPENNHALDTEKREIIDNLMKSVNEEIDKLPEACGTVLRLQYYYGMRLRHIAQLLGMSEETVKNKKKYAIRMLKKRLGDNPLYKHLKIR